MQKDFDAAVAEVRAKAEKHFPQFLDFVDAQNKLIVSGSCLLTGDSEREDYEQFLQLVAHVEQLWEAACTLYHSKYYPLSVFLAISCLEETGKIGVSRFQLVLRHAHRERAVASELPTKIARRSNPFFSHPEKHLLVAGAGAIVNSRLDRILGLARVSQFLEDVRNGAVERLRQSALYADFGESGPVLPDAEIREDQARFYIVLAGELMAEVLGLEPPEWERLLEKVQAFERKIGHPWK